MTGGRRKVPPQSRLIAGESVRKDRDYHGANAPLELPPCPLWLPKSAKKHWSTLGPQLVAIGLLSVIDGDVFAIHCDNVTRYADVVEQLDELKNWHTTTPNGFEVQSVLLQIRNKLQDQIIKTAREFGLTPSARSSIRSVDAPQGDLFGDDAASRTADPFEPQHRVS
jgi:P27 family predicted phage terminase small subunit